MTNYFYSEEFKDFPKSQKQQQKLQYTKPSKLSLQFVLGYGAALRVLKSRSIGNMKVLMN